ncbi:MAG: hypothetical protein FK730_08350 [Asgard group archaeon]|nr:hypothetical protein [Asgard group archaeon]
MSFEVDEQTRNQLEDEIWGDYCPQCNFWGRPIIKGYQLKNEEVHVISCPECDSTIVVIELEKKPRELVHSI